MATSIVDKSNLSPATNERIQACGHPLWFVRSDGESRGHWRCGNSWCEYCADRRRVHVFHCVRRRLSEPTYYLVTLTVPRQRRDQSAEALQHQLALLGRLWRGAQTRLRWYARRGIPDYVLPPTYQWGALEGQLVPEYTSTWRGGQWSTRTTSGCWVRELTFSYAQGWNAHVHAIVDTLSEAELLNAAWQCEYQAAEWCGDVRRWFLKTDISKIKGERGAAYISNYLAKKDLAKIPRARHADYVRGVRNMRRCDAWGAYRPLGIRRVSSGDVTHVRRDSWQHAVPIALYYGATELGRALRRDDSDVLVRLQSQLVVDWLHRSDSAGAESVMGVKQGDFAFDQAIVS